MLWSRMNERHFRLASERSETSNDFNLTEHIEWLTLCRLQRVLDVSVT